MTDVWSCHVCGTIRPDPEIGVVSRWQDASARARIRHSLRYCRPDQRCITAAKNWADTPNPRTWEDGLVKREFVKEESGKPWALLLIGSVILIMLALVIAGRGEAHLIRLPDHPQKSVLENRLASQQENLYHARYVCRHGAGKVKAWHCQAATGWLLREFRETQGRLEPWWIARQIEVAEILGKDGDAQGTDPWPNCPDPYDHRGHSWIDTLACESPTLFARYGNTPKGWLDPVGFYRCGLQFDPDWEDRYGRLCP